MGVFSVFFLVDVYGGRIVVPLFTRETTFLGVTVTGSSFLSGMIDFEATCCSMEIILDGATFLFGFDGCCRFLSSMMFVGVDDVSSEVGEVTDDVSSEVGEVTDDVTFSFSFACCCSCCCFCCCTVRR